MSNLLEKKIFSLREINNGELFRLYANGKLYIRGDYDRKAHMYRVRAFDSVGPDHFFYSDTLVYRASISEYK